MNNMKHQFAASALAICLALVLAVGLLVQTAPDACAGNGGLIGANIKDGKLIGYYGEGGDIVIPNTVTSIEPEAFKGNDNVTSITIPGSVQSIGYSAFEQCSALERVTFSDPKDGADLTIRVSAFLDCPKLSDITIPACAKYVTGNVFKGCTSLKAIHVDPDNPYYAEQDSVLFGPNVIEGEPQYDDTTHYTLIAYPAGKEKGSYQVPSSVHGRTVDRIWASAFRKCENLTGIQIADTVEEIGGNAFEETGLTKITLPETVKSVGTGLFENCTQLTDVELPRTVTELGMSFFDGCTSLQRIQMDHVRVIGMYAFRNCQSLTNLILPEGLTSISSSSAFDKCSNLQRVYLPSSVINFPSDSELGAFNIFPEAAGDLLVYVVKGSTGEKYAVNNAQDFKWNYKVLNSRADLTTVQDGDFSLIDMGKKIKVTGAFQMGSSLNVTDVEEREETAFRETANGKQYRSYHIGVLPQETRIPDRMTLAVGIPKGILSKGAMLYGIQNGNVVKLEANSVSKTLSTSVTALGPVAVIGEPDPSVTPDQPAEPESITLNRSTASVKTGRSITLTSTVLPERAGDKKVTWASSEATVATVSKGIVTGVAPGKATITATTVNGKQAACEVTVIDGSEISAASAGILVPGKAESDGSVSFRLALTDPSRIATVSVTFRADGMEDGATPNVKGQNGFQTLGTKQQEDGSYTAVLSYLEDSRLFSADGKQEIAVISIQGKTPSLTLSDIKISGWKLDEVAAYGMIGSVDTAKKTFQPLSPYDFNEDGVVDGKDLAAAEAYYRTGKTDVGYSQAEQYDVNGDGMIDTEDFVLIQANRNDGRNEADE